MSAETEAQKHRIAGVGRDLWGSSSPNPLPKQGHGENSSPFDYTNWLPVFLPSFEPLHLPQLTVTTVRADVPSDRPVRLRSHLERYTHTLGVNLGSGKSFDSLFPSCHSPTARSTEIYRHSFSCIFNRFPLPANAGPRACCRPVSLVAPSPLAGQRADGVVLGHLCLTGLAGGREGEAGAGSWGFRLLYRLAMTPAT